jgi:hypothetical protein
MSDVEELRAQLKNAMKARGLVYGPADIDGLRAAFLAFIPDGGPRTAPAQGGGAPLWIPRVSASRAHARPGSPSSSHRAGTRGRRPLVDPPSQCEPSTCSARVAQ